MDLKEVINRSIKIREQYHKLENEYHGSEWFIEEDALAFLTDAGLVGRLTMDNQGRWPADNGEERLKHKLGECVWWLAVLADRMNLDLDTCVSEFLDKTEKNF
ncbi:MazG-like protein [bacterium]|nr:MazG-like protein [bacterium]